MIQQLLNHRLPFNFGFHTQTCYAPVNEQDRQRPLLSVALHPTILWMPCSNTTSTLNSAAAGNYELTVADQNNCSTSISATILNDKPQPIFLGGDTTLCPGDHIILFPGIYNSYKWQDNSASANYTVTNPGTYTVEVTDDRACVLKDTIRIIADCGF